MDRGIKKWQGFFMTEHIKMLEDADLDSYKQPRPQLVEGQIEDMERMLSEGLGKQSLLEITIWQKGISHSKMELIKKLDAINKKI